jgi:trigger factor
MIQEREIINFKSAIVDKKLCSITMDVEVSENIVAHEIESAFNQIRLQVKIDGFRHGKVPMSVIRQRFAEEAKNKAVENIIRKTVLNALERESFNPIDFHVVEGFKYEFGQTLMYRFTAECHPKIDVRNYKDIPITKELFRITDQSLMQTLDALRERNAKLVPSKSGEVTEKSFVLVDYDAFDDVDGKAIPEINAKGYMIDLSSGNTLLGFKEALVGTKIGDEKNIRIGCSEDYLNKTLTGATIIFKTKVVEVKEKELSKLNDDFAKDMGAENLEDLKIKIKEIMEVEEKRRQKAAVEGQIIEYLLEKNKFEVPESLIAVQKNSLVVKMKEYMQNKGASKEYVEKQAEFGETKFKEVAEKNVRLSYIFNAIYLTENLVITDADIEAEKNKMKILNSERESAIDKYFREKKESVMISLKEQKIFRFLLENAKIKVEEKDIPLKRN